MNNVVPTPEDKQKALDSKSGDILLASLAIAGAVVVFVGLLPSTSIGKIPAITVGGITISVVTALLLCGLLAIGASILTVFRMSQEAKLARTDFFKYNLGYLILALFLFGLIYVAITTWFLVRGT